ncbi:MAG: hypothetical protein ABL997_01720 [Planctomycetota bacterium]
MHPTIHALVLASLCTQLAAQRQDHLYFVSREPTNNLTVIGSRDPQSGLPYVVDRQTISGAPSGHAPTASYIDREGFLWLLDDNQYVTKFVPPPIPASSRVVFRVRTTSALPKDLAFDANGNAWVCAGNGLGFEVVYHIDHASGAVLGSVAVGAFGPVRRIFAHENGDVFVQASSLVRVRAVGATLVASLFRGGFHFDLTGLPDGNLLVSRDHPGPGGAIDLAVLDAASGVELRASSTTVAGEHPYTSLFALPLSGGDALALGVPTGGACSQRTGMETTRLSDFAHPAPSLCFFQTPISNGQEHGRALTFDGSGRAYAYNGLGEIGYSDASRTAVAAHTVITFAGASFQTPFGVVLGDPSGIVRATTIDRFFDDDGDGFNNLDEVQNGGNPFDASVSPASHPPTLFVSPTAPVGGQFQMVLTGEPVAPFALGYGALAPVPLSLPPFVGQLLLDPASFSFLFLTTSSLPIVMPATGTFALTFGVPNDPGLINVILHFQGIVFATTPARSGFSGRGDLLIQ